MLATGLLSSIAAREKKNGRANFSQIIWSPIPHKCKYQDPLIQDQKYTSDFKYKPV